MEASPDPSNTPKPEQPTDTKREITATTVAGFGWEHVETLVKLNEQLHERDRRHVQWVLGIVGLVAIIFTGFGFWNVNTVKSDAQEQIRLAVPRFETALAVKVGEVTKSENVTKLVNDAVQEGLRRAAGDEVRRVAGELRRELESVRSEAAQVRTEVSRLKSELQVTRDYAAARLASAGALIEFETCRKEWTDGMPTVGGGRLGIFPSECLRRLFAEASRSSVIQADARKEIERIRGHFSRLLQVPSESACPADLPLADAVRLFEIGHRASRPGCVRFAINAVRKDPTPLYRGFAAESPPGFSRFGGKTELPFATALMSLRFNEGDLFMNEAECSKKAKRELGQP